MICYDYRFPELHREYMRQGVQLVFHSFHAANASAERLAAIGAAIGSDLGLVNELLLGDPVVRVGAALTLSESLSARLGPPDLERSAW